MTKLATVQRLNDSAPQLEILQQLRELRQALEALPELTQEARSLREMPRELAQELSQQLLPLSDLSTKVQRLAVQFDQLNQRQRQTLDALTAEMVAKASQSFAAEAAKLSTTIETQTKAIKALEATATRAETATKKLAKMPEQLDEAKRDMLDASETIRDRIPSLRQMLALAVATGLVAGLAAAGAVLWLDSKPPAQLESVALRVMWEQQQLRPHVEAALQRASSLTRAQ